MPRKLAITISGAIVPPTTAALESLTWWKKVKHQDRVIASSESLAQHLYINGRSRLGIGKDLLDIQKVLEPQELWYRFLKQFHFKKTSAYRYINEYKNSTSRLPEPVVQLAMARNLNIG